MLYVAGYKFSISSYFSMILFCFVLGKQLFFPLSKHFTRTFMFHFRKEKLDD